MLRPVSILAAAVMGLCLLNIGARAASAADPGTEAQFVSLMNADRAQQGLAALTVDPQLTAVARNWSDTIERNGGLSHNPGIEGELPAGWTRWGENVGTGPSVASLEAAFMASPDHRANILGAYSLVGVGVDVTGDGIIWVTVDFVALGPGAVTVSCTDSNPAPEPSHAAASGYYVLGTDGGVFSYGSAVFHGSVPGLGVRANAILMALTPDHAGYWVLGSDGGVFTFGDAVFHGSVPGIGCEDATGVELAATSTGLGYYVLSSDGKVFPFGDAPGFGDPSGLGVRAVDLAVIAG